MQELSTISVVASALRFSQCAAMLGHHEIREEMIRQLDAKKLQPKDVADRLNLPSSRVAEMRKRTRRVQHSEMQPLAQLLGMAEDGQPVAAAPSLDDLAAEYGIALLEELDLALGMGATFLDGHPEVLGIVPFKLDWLRGLHDGPLERLKVVRGKGDSMQPTIHDGDVILVDTAQRRIDDQDRIWAIAYGELGMIRRIRVRPSGIWSLMPDNKVVDPEEVGDGEVAVIGRVIWIGRRF